MSLVRRGPLAAAALLFASLGGCDDGAAPATFDVRISAEPELVGNAPLTVALRAPNNGPLEAEYAYAWAFSDGAESDEATPTHTFTTPGEHTIEVAVQAGGAQGKATERFTLAPSADLVVEDVGFQPRRVQGGERIEATWRLRNAGADPAAPWRLQVFVSADAAFDPADVVVFEQRYVAGEAEAGGTFSFDLPDSLPSGDWFVGVVADPDARIGDANRVDNAAFASFSLQVRNPTDNGPDLVPCGLTIPAFEALPAGQVPVVQMGDQLPVQVCMTNLGNAPVAIAGYRLYLSRDALFDPEDLPVGQRGGFALGAGDQDTFEDLLDLPAEGATGRWSLLLVADADEAVAEQREDNNVRGWPGEIELAEPGEVAGVDLALAALEINEDQAFWGQALTGQVRLVNRGDTDVVRSFVVRLFAVPTGAGETVQLRSLNLAGLAAGAEETFDLQLPINQRLSQGTYQIRAEADPGGATDDVNPTNNQRTLQRPLALGGEPDFDLVATGTDFAPAQVDAGAELTVTARIENPGSDPTGGFDVAIVLSADARLDGDDPVLDVFAVPSIEANGGTDVSRAVVVPDSLDQAVAAWQVIVVADPANRLTGERDEANNAAFAASPLVVNGAMGGCAEDQANEPNDVRGQARALPAGVSDGLALCDDADWFEVDVAAGTTLEVTLTPAPDGGQPRLRVVDDSDALVAEGEAVAAGLLAFVAPVAEARTLYLAITADAPVAYALSVSLVAPADAPDLRVRAVQALPGVVEAGSTVAVRYELVNGGTAEAPPQSMAVALLPAAGGAAIELGTHPAEALAGGATRPGEVRIDLPRLLPDGRYTLQVTADSEGAIDEANEDNNVGLGELRVDADQACPADPFEPNGSGLEGSVATGPAVLLPGVYPGLASCRGDDDWYAVDVVAGQRIDAEVQFTNDDGDLELTLYDTDGATVLDQSAGFRDVESVALLRAPADGRYFVRVHLSAGDALNVDNTYQLTLTLGDADACADDGFEPNGAREAAALLPDGAHDLVLCAGDEDWFRFNIPVGNTVSFQVASGAAGARIALFGPDGALIDEDGRRITHEAASNGVYLLRVSVQADDAVAYSLTVAGVSGIDLEVTEVSLSAAEAEAGQDLRVTTTVANRRGDGAVNVLVRYVLSADERVSADDRVLGEGRVPALPGAQTVQFSQRLTVPDDAPGGAQFVLVEVDPERDVADLRPGNNVAGAALSVVAACVDDDPRSNEGPRTPTPLVAEDGQLEDAVICAFTEDWYRLPVAAAGAVTVTLAFDGAAGDLDLQVFDGAGEALLGESRTEAAPEVAEFMLAAPGDLLIRVDGFLDARNVYTLTWTLPE